MNHTFNETSEALLTLKHATYSFAVNYTSVIVFIIAIALYAAYYCYFHNILFEIKGNYNQKKKHLGKTLPPFPNGWYVA
jgi:hypothetical protein